VGAAADTALSHQQRRPVARLPPQQQHQQQQPQQPRRRALLGALLGGAALLAPASVTPPARAARPVVNEEVDNDTSPMVQGERCRTCRKLVWHPTRTRRRRHGELHNAAAVATHLPLHPHPRAHTKKHKEMLRRTREKKDERTKQRLRDYNRRNFKDYFTFDATGSSGKARGIRPETQAAIEKWLSENE
jgi:hypothetical protein